MDEKDLEEKEKDQRDLEGVNDPMSQEDYEKAFNNEDYKKVGCADLDD